MAAPQIGENTKVTLDLKTIGLIIGGVVSLTTMWFALQSDIALAMEMPEPVIDRVEYDLKDELIRQTIMDTQEDVEAIQDQLIDQAIDLMYSKYPDIVNNKKMKRHFLQMLVGKITQGDLRDRVDLNSFIKRLKKTRGVETV